MANSTPPLARRMAEIAPFRVMDILARARELETQGRSIVHMEVGEPDFPTPKPICEAGIAALRKGELHYTPAPGLSELREAIAGHYRVRDGIDVAPSRIVVTTGSSGALLLALGALVNPGDQVLLADPGYPCNRNFVRLLEGEPVGVAVGPDGNYQLTPELLEQHWGSRTAAAIVASPSNPTGTIVPSAHLKAMVQLARERGGTLIVDEIYHGLVYEGEATSALTFADDVFVVNSFSKYFNMTGWRLGWLVVPERYLREVDKLAQNIFISPPAPAQFAALAAFLPETLAIAEAHRAEFKERRDYLVPALRALGFDIPHTPDGAFYVYAGCAGLTADSFAFTHDLLERAGVAIAPGIDFGANRPHEHVRFSYTKSLDVLAEGVRRIGEFLRRR
ncbi:MAG: pyridoxal phosphate-dependent aminotransferase [Betaproteobacteria bacterium]|nr:pyridoxal phosphate-dependent aminotransferase [Betaproteobacteria bacterium]